MRIAELPYLMIAGLAILSFLLAAACLFGMIRAFTMEADVRFRILFAGMLLPCLAMVQGLESVCVQVSQGGLNAQMADLPLKMPVWFVVAAFAGFTVCLTAAWILMKRQIRAELTTSSLLEGLDYMPDGISFNTDEGIPLMVNRKMQTICDIAFGTGVLNMNRLWERLKTGDLAPGCRAQQKGEAVFLHLPDGSSLAFYDKMLPVEGVHVRECIAYDITEQYQKSREMEKRNERMEAVNEKIREYSRNLDAITREREILAAKIRIHDDVGRSLLALRSYLAQRDGDRKSLVDQWRFTIAALKREEVSRDTVDRMEALAQAAQAVGVKLTVEGALPENPAVQEVAAAAIHECLTNTVKHANGSELTVHTKIENGMVTMELKNNGKTPDGPVEEKGGLRTLRMIVRQHGGRMELISKPEFLLRIRMNLDGKEE